MEEITEATFGGMEEEAVIADLTEFELGKMYYEHITGPKNEGSKKCIRMYECVPGVSRGYVTLVDLNPIEGANATYPVSQDILKSVHFRPVTAKVMPQYLL